MRFAHLDYYLTECFAAFDVSAAVELHARLACDLGREPPAAPIAALRLRVLLRSVAFLASAGLCAPATALTHALLCVHAAAEPFAAAKASLAARWDVFWDGRVQRMWAAGGSAVPTETDPDLRSRSLAARWLAMERAARQRPARDDPDAGWAVGWEEVEPFCVDLGGDEQAVLQVAECLLVSAGVSVGMPAAAAAVTATVDPFLAAPRSLAFARPESLLYPSWALWRTLGVCGDAVAPFCRIALVDAADERHLLLPKTSIVALLEYAGDCLAQHRVAVQTATAQLLCHWRLDGAQHLKDALCKQPDSQSLWLSLVALMRSKGAGVAAEAIARRLLAEGAAISDRGARLGLVQHVAELLLQRGAPSEAGLFIARSVAATGPVEDLSPSLLLKCKRVRRLPAAMTAL